MDQILYYKRKDKNKINDINNYDSFKYDITTKILMHNTAQKAYIERTREAFPF
jgi:hypothetical protein